MSSAKKSAAQLKFTITQRDVLHQGYFQYVRNQVRFELFNGGFSDVVTRETLERSSAIGVLPYDPVLDRVVLIEQFRIGATYSLEPKPWLTEIICGCIEENETVTDVVHREAQEEAGCTITALHAIVDYFVTPSCSNEYIHLFCGKIDASNLGGIHGLTAESEDIRAFTLAASEAFELLHSGQIKTAPTIIALQWLQSNRDWLRRTWQN